MKRILFAACALTFAACGTQQVGVTVTNRPGAQLPGETMAELDARLLPPSAAGYIVRDHEGTEIPSQLTYDSLLIFQPRFEGEESLKFTVEPGAAAEYGRRTFGRSYPERYDDFAWENDRVAFRIYGAALKPVDGPSNGIDAWYKRTGRLILDEWYADDIAGRASYHTDRGEGLDDYKVGRTLGAGAMAPFVDGALILGENFEHAELLDSGVLRTTFRLYYAGGEVRTISLDAGSQLTRIVQEYAPGNAPGRVAAGFPMRDGKPVNVRQGEGWMIFEEPPTQFARDVSLGLVLPGAQYIDANGHVLLEAPYNAPVTYYTGYGWGMAGMTAEGFAEYLERFARGLETPLKIEL